MKRGPTKPADFPEIGKKNPPFSKALGKTFCWVQTANPLFLNPFFTFPPIFRVTHQIQPQQMWYPDVGQRWQTFPILPSPVDPARCCYCVICRTVPSCDITVRGTCQSMWGLSVTSRLWRSKTRSGSKKLRLRAWDVQFINRSCPLVSFENFCWDAERRETRLIREGNGNVWPFWISKTHSEPRSRGGVCSCCMYIVLMPCPDPLSTALDVNGMTRTVRPG